MSNPKDEKMPSSENGVVVPEPDKRTASEFYDVPEIPSDPKLRKSLRRKIMKNIYVISFVFLLHFTAYSGLSNLQSSLHKDEGMGTVTQSVLYAAMVLSCLFLPKIMISAIGHKWTMPISLAGYILWMAANGYAVWGTMIPTSILVGISAAPLWTAQCAYFTKIAPKYAELSGESDSAVVTRFFGIFFGLFQLSGVIGSVISSTVLSPSEIPGENETLSAAEVELYCGVNDCPWNNVSNPNLEDPASSTVWTLVGIYIGIACVGVLVVCTCVDNLPLYLHDDKTKVRQEAKKSVVNTVLHLRHTFQLCLIPLTIYSGLEQGFFGAEWTKSYVSCSMGIWMVGFVMIPANAVNALTAFSLGHVVKYTGRIPLFTIGLVVHLTLQLVLLLWPLDKDKEYAFYLIAASWGFTDGIWQAQINALYGVLWPNDSEAAFCNYRMWESAGFIVAFAYSSFLCTEVKLYVVMATLIVGLIGYYIVEIKYMRGVKDKLKDGDDMKSVIEEHVNGAYSKKYDDVIFDNGDLYERNEKLKFNGSNGLVNQSFQVEQEQVEQTWF